MTVLPTGKELIDPRVVLEIAGIREGETVADLGCGALGHYVFPAAAMVGKSGKVYAVDILKSVLASIQSRIQLEEITQVEAVWGDIERSRGVPLADGSVKTILLINNLFLARNKVAVGQEAFRLLPSGGKLLLVDWKPTGIPLGPAASERVTREQARLVMQTAGFRFVREFEPGQYHYGLAFEKP